jgi:hypothetical protein
LILLKKENLNFQNYQFIKKTKINFNSLLMKHKNYDVF